MVCKDLALQTQGLVFLTWGQWQVEGGEAGMVAHTSNPEDGKRESQAEVQGSPGQAS